MDRNISINKGLAWALRRRNKTRLSGEDKSPGNCWTEGYRPFVCARVNRSVELTFGGEADCGAPGVIFVTTEMMTGVNSRRLELKTVLGLFCFLIPLMIQLLWIHAFKHGDNQLERVDIFLAYFPAFLGLTGITILEVVLCIVAIVISIQCLKLSNILWKLISIITIVGCTLILLLILFGFL
jgi:hypothetical protein